MHKTRNFGGTRPAHSAARTPGGGNGRNVAITVAPAVASALRIRNFRALSEVAGEENLSLALDMPLNRIREMLEGINFSNEIAFHIESTLSLTSGHMDQVNPAITEETRNLLKSPLQLTSVLDSEAESNVISFTTKESIVTTSTINAKPEGIATSFGSKMHKAPQADNSEKKSLKTSSQEAPAPLSPLAAEEHEVRCREIRKANLIMLTQGIGAKTHLAKITGLSPANISHRLHGNKHFDRETADLFTNKLGLPEGWLDTPQILANVPLEAQNLLSGGTGNMARVTKQKKVKSPVITPSFTGVGSTLQIKQITPSENKSRESFAANSAEKHVPANSTNSLLPLESATGLAPIAEALVKTIIGRARLGALTEESAFKILQDVMAS